MREGLDHLGLTQIVQRARLPRRTHRRRFHPTADRPGVTRGPSFRDERFTMARESNTPEPSRYHGIVHFRVLSQHLGAVLGRDRNGLCGNPLAIAANLTVQGSAVTVAKTVQEFLRDLSRIHPDRTLRQWRVPALQARQVEQRFQSQRIYLPRLPEMTQAPEGFLANRFFEAIRQQ